MKVHRSSKTETCSKTRELKERKISEEHTAVVQMHTVILCHGMPWYQSDQPLMPAAHGPWSLKVEHANKCGRSLTQTNSIGSA